jgi:hypothetical protein
VYLKVLNGQDESDLIPTLEGYFTENEVGRHMWACVGLGEGERERCVDSVVSLHVCVCVCVCVCIVARRRMRCGYK